MSDFTDEDIDLVWSKGLSPESCDSSKYRLDVAGAMMRREDYGKNSLYGWEIDHIYPKKLLEENKIPEDKWDNIINLRPMNSSNNAAKGDDYPKYSSVIKFDEKERKNKEICQSCTVGKSIQNDLAEFFGLKQ